MTSQVMRFLVAVGILLLTVVPVCRSEQSTVKSPFGSRMAPECRPGDYYKEPHEVYCERYYVCNEGKAEEETCSTGSLYHCGLEVCYPVSSETDISEICCAGKITENPLPGTPPTIPSGSTTTPTTTTTTTTTTPAPTCTAIGAGDSPHPTDCTKYYTCDETSGEATLKECPEDEGFDSESSSCKPLGEVKCEDGATLPPPVTSTTPTGTPSDSTFTATPSGPTSTEIPVECPAEGDHMLPYPKDCSKYIRCIGGTPSLLRCRGCTLFDIDRLQCVGYNSAKCLNGTDIPEYDTAVCSGCILSSWRLLTMTFILIVTFFNTNNLLV